MYRIMTMDNSIIRRAENNVAIRYDTTAQAPHFDYRDAEGTQHKVKIRGGYFLAH
jgi:spore germination protein